MTTRDELIVHSPDCPHSTHSVRREIERLKREIGRLTAENERLIESRRDLGKRYNAKARDCMLAEEEVRRLIAENGVMVMDMPVEEPMSEDLVDELLRDGRSWLGCARRVGLRWRPQRHFVKVTGELEIEAAEEILLLRRQLAVQWRDWDDVTELDAKLAAVQSVAQHPSDPPDPSANDDSV